MKNDEKNRKISEVIREAENGPEEDYTRAVLEAAAMSEEIMDVNIHQRNKVMLHGEIFARSVEDGSGVEVCMHDSQTGDRAWINIMGSMVRIIAPEKFAAAGRDTDRMIRIICDEQDNVCMRLYYHGLVSSREGTVS